MFRILVTDTINLGQQHFEAVEIDYQAGIERARLLDIIANYDALITRSRTKVDHELISRASKLQVIGRGGVGVDNIDLEAASRHGILVLNAPEANNVSAAELALALMLNAARGVHRSDKLIREGSWDRKFLGKELKDAKLGIIGLGRIGSLVARRAQGLGMQVLAYDPYINRKRAEDLRVELIDELSQLLSQVQFLTVHTPLTDETRGMIGAAELSLLPDQAIVVNAARGGIIQEDALYEALKHGKLFAAGLDVFVIEPPDPKHPLLSLDNIVFTAHLGANTVEAQARVGSDILLRTVRALEGDISTGVVNAPALDAHVMQALGKHLELGEILGKMLSQLAKGRVRELTIEFSGDFPSNPDPISVAVTKGFLEPMLDTPPNYINAPAIAKERDIRISKISASRTRSYTNHVDVKALSDKGTYCVGGTIVAGNPRVVNINDFVLEMKPEATMLVCTNYDRPGVVGKVGTLLGDAGVNISSMQLSRINEDGLAMFILTLDQAPTNGVLDQLSDLPNIIHEFNVVKL